jgi:hypothetical protein
MKSFSKYYVILFLVLLASCVKMDSEELRNFPEGISLVDSESENDCSLPRCSEDRIVRLIADGVEGVLVKDSDDEFYVKYTYPIDTQLQFYFCDLPLEFRVDGLEIRFDGQLIDACGIKTPIFGGQQFYLVRLADITLL